MERMFESFANYIEEKKLIKRGEESHIVIGVSGGADSVCMPVLMKRFCDEMHPEYDVHITAVHINHNIRGKSAENDQAFVEKLCGKMDVPCIVFSEDVVGAANEQGLSVEEAGRKIRYEKFRETAAQIAKKNPKDTVKIAVAHHKDDNAETIIFNLLRGSNLKGISGMKAKSYEKGFEIIRPLLFAGRSDIEAYLNEIGADYVTDETNADTEISRNRIRLEIIPEMKRINPQAVEHIVKAAESVNAAEEYLEEETEKAFEEAIICEAENAEAGRKCCKEEADCSSDKDKNLYKKNEQCRFRLNAEYLKGLKPIIAERVIYKAITKAAGGAHDISYVHVNDVKKLLAMQTGKRIDLPQNVTAVKENNELVFYKNKEKCAENKYVNEFSDIKINLDTLDEKQTIKLPGGSQMTLEKISVNKANFDELIFKNLYTKTFDYDKISGSLFLGTRKNGDKISLKNGMKNLNRIFVDEKIPQAERDRILVLKDEKEILWIVGMRIGEKYKITENTKTALRVQIAGEQQNG